MQLIYGNVHDSTGSCYNHVDAAFDEEKNGYVARDQLLYAL